MIPELLPLKSGCRPVEVLSHSEGCAVAMSEILQTEGLESARLSWEKP